MIRITTLFFLFLLGSSLHAMTQKVSHKETKIDDWDYNATQIKHHKSSRIAPMAMPKMTMASPVPMAMESALGFSVGGAKDANNFYENIKQGYLPKIDSITYEGVFYDHYFTSPKKEKCENLFCPSYSTAISKNPFTGEDEYYLSVGLDSNIKEDDFKRKKLNIVVVLDISGSMGSPFNQYYYDNNQKIMLDEKERKKSKMQLASEAIVNMIDYLDDEDQLGVVLFDNEAYHAKPLRPIQYTNISAIKKHIMVLKERGGTNWSAGYKKGITLFDTLEGNMKDPSIYENRILFLTDAMPNRGELKKEGLFSIAKEASKKDIHTTFIGIGVDFNNDLVEAVSKTKGANYYAIHSSKAFKKRLADEFDYMVTPLVYDLSLTIGSQDFSIQAVYGSPDANRSSGNIMYVNTLFPSPTTQEGTKGGVILLKLHKHHIGAKNLNLSVSYHDRDKQHYKTQKSVQFESGDYHDNGSIQKSILLTRYVDLMKNFTMDMRKGCQDGVERHQFQPFLLLKRHCTLYPPDRPHFPYIKTWERKSCPLFVSAGYQKIFSLFSQHFKKEKAVLQDNSLSKELEILLQLQKQQTGKEGKIDDWTGVGQ